MPASGVPRPRHCLETQGQTRLREHVNQTVASSRKQLVSRCAIGLLADGMKLCGDAYDVAVAVAAVVVVAVVKYGVSCTLSAHVSSWKRPVC